jgi:hypothetical protein
MEQQNRLTETRRKRQAISHTALRRSTTAKSPGYRDGYEKVRSATFKGIRKGIKRMLEQIWRGHENREPARTSGTVSRGDGNLLGYQNGYVKVRFH